MVDEVTGSGVVPEIMLRGLAKEAVLAGHRTTTSIMKSIGLNDDATAKIIASFLQDGAFVQECEQARTNIEETVLKWFKARGLKYAKGMDKLTECGDPRVQFQANKDALDRIGTRPEERVRVSGIDAYKQLIQELMPDKKEKDDGSDVHK